MKKEKREGAREVYKAEGRGIVCRAQNWARLILGIVECNDASGQISRVQQRSNHLSQAWCPLARPN